MKRAYVRVSSALLLERLFGRDGLPHTRLDQISVDQHGHIVLQIVGDEVPEGECVGIYRQVMSIDGPATIFDGLHKRD